MAPKARQTKAVIKKSKKKGSAAVARSKNTTNVNLQSTYTNIIATELPLPGTLKLLGRLRNVVINTATKIKTKLASLFRRSNASDSSKV